MFRSDTLRAFAQKWVAGARNNSVLANITYYYIMAVYYFIMACKETISDFKQNACPLSQPIEKMKYLGYPIRKYFECLSARHWGKGKLVIDLVLEIVGF